MTTIRYHLERGNEACVVGNVNKARAHFLHALAIIDEAPRPTLKQYGGWPEEHVILHDPQEGRNGP